MSSRSVVTFTSGVSGSGKTYYRCAAFLVEEWLPLHDGVLISNYPINVENLVRDFGEEVRKRIEIIPDAILKEWREGRSGPWDYLRDRNIQGCHIAIDEIHNYCPKTADAKIRKKWMQFVGELRHTGATVEFLSQNEGKVAKELIAEAEIRYEIINGENFKLPILGYRMGDLYEFRAKLLGKYICPSFCREYTQASGDWVLQDEKTFYRLPKYFEYYNSYNAPSHGLAEGRRSELRPWEKYSWPMLFLWFLMTYYIRIGFHICCISVFAWAFFFGGIKGCVHGVVDRAFGKKPQKVQMKPDSSSSDSLAASQTIPESQAKKFIPEIKPNFPVKPYRLLTPDMVVFKDGWKLSKGDFCYGSTVKGFDCRSLMVILDDGFFFPLSWISQKLEDQDYE